MLQKREESCSLNDNNYISDCKITHNSRNIKVVRMIFHKKNGIYNIYFEEMRNFAPIMSMNEFKLTSKYSPTGDQPEAIRLLTEGIQQGERSQVLLGVTGSGKTFTMANVIANVNRPTLILSHNKTLAAQLYEEMKGFFPDNAVEYYVSYYDYYQPEAYIPHTDTYIEKDLAINEEIDRLRLSAVSSLLSGRRDVVVVSSVSCIYGMGGPSSMQGSIISVKRGEKIDRNAFLRKLVDALYVRNDIAFPICNLNFINAHIVVFL